MHITIFENFVLTFDNHNRQSKYNLKNYTYYVYLPTNIFLISFQVIQKQNIRSRLF